MRSDPFRNLNQIIRTSIAVKSVNKFERMLPVDIINQDDINPLHDVAKMADAEWECIFL